MSAENTPQSAQESGRHPMHAKARSYSVMDRIRAQELTRRIELGESPTAAWAVIVTDPAIGYSKYRGREKPLKAGKVQKSLERFVARAADPEMEAALNLGRIQAAKLVPEALDTTRQILSGDFGKGRVRVKGQDEDRYLEVDIDSPAAAVRLKAARTILEITRVMPKGNGQAGTTVNVSQTVNTGVLVVPEQPTAAEWVAQVEDENVRTRPPGSESGAGTD